MSETPITRVEKLAAAIVNGSVINEKGIPRMAHYLKCIMEGTTATEVPQTRAEHYLAKIAGMDVEIEQPVTRLEHYLASIAGLSVDLPSPVTRLEHLLYDWAEAWAGELKTVSGSVISVADALAKAVDDLTVSIEPVQSGSGTPSPSNVRPISGWDKVKVTRTGKNLFDAVNLVDGYISVSNGEVLPQTSPYVAEVASDYIPIKNGQAYIFSLRIDNLEEKWIGIGLYDVNKNFITRVGGLKGTDTDISQVVGSSYSANAYYARVSYRSYGIAENMQFELGTTATEYEPYVGNTYEIDLDGTRYGGTLDVTTGVLTVTHAIMTKKTADMSNAENFPGWQNSGIKAIIGPDINSSMQEGLLNVGTTFGANTTGGYDILFLPFNVYHITESEWKEMNIDIQLCVRLATPITIQLTPQEITMLKGNNTIWADAGDSTLRYWAQA